MNEKFSSPPDRNLFNALVWEIARQIPPGKVCSYGQIAVMIPPPAGMTLKAYEGLGARWVGGAMAACPSDVPWQRVVNSQGKISLPKGPSHDHQRQLLESEGILFDEKERIDFARFRWSGPSVEFRQANGLLPGTSTSAPSQMEMPI